MLSRVLEERRGSTFVAVLAAIAIMITLATVITPALVGVLEFERVDRAAKELTIYERALGSFSTDLSVRPQAVRQLTRAISSTDLNSCGEAYNRVQLRDGWQGPYMVRVVPSHGNLPLDIGIVEDTLVRRPGVARNRNDRGELIIRVTNVEQHEANALDRRVDGGPVDAAAGKVRWGTADSTGFVTVEYTIAVTGC